MQASTQQVTPSTSMPRKILRWILRITGSLIALVIVIFVLGVLINLKDEPLSAEAQALMAAPRYVADPNKNGYFVFRAMDADEGLDVLKTGREITDKYAQLAQENPNRTDWEKKYVYKKAPKSTWDMTRCKPATGNCVEADLRNRAKIEAALSQNALLLRRYEMIQELPEFEEHSIFWRAPFPAYPLLVQASDMALTKAAFDIADRRMESGINQLKKNDQCLRKLVQQTSPLISRMFAVAMIRKQARVVSELVETYPGLVGQYGDALGDLTRPLSVKELSFVPVFSSEARMILVATRGIQINYSVFGYSFPEEEPSMPERILGRVAALFYQRNATVNMMASSWPMLIREANDPSSDYTIARHRLTEQASQLGDHRFLPYIHYFSNPVGKFFNANSPNSDSWIDYMERSADVDGYLRLVGLQVDVRRKKIAENAIQDHANKAGPQFRSPYDGKPMTWVADKKQLQFIGRQRATSNLDGKNIFIAQMR